jgi:release factor glutamine methyltransferase
MELEGRVDALVSNPPYVAANAVADLPPEVRADPVDALVGGTEVHARLAAAAWRWFRPGGWLLVEIGDDQGDEVRSILLRAGFEGVRVLPDLTGRDRIVRGSRPAGTGTRAVSGGGSMDPSDPTPSPSR